MPVEEPRTRLEEALARCRRDPVLGRALIQSGDGGRRALAQLEALGARALLPEDEDFPPALRTIPDAPTYLFALGRLPPAGSGAVALVGTRHPSPTGRRFAEEAGYALAAAGVPVVSGLARGIDACAHVGALRARGRDTGVVPTVAVVATGLDSCYPAEHRTLFRQIAEAGAILSEFPPGSPPIKVHFIRRNRLLAGLARLTVVVEAREKSGALVTAQYAAEQGSEVAALPGDVYNPAAAGPNRLLADGAAPVAGVAALLEHATLLGILPRAARRRGRRAVPPAPADLGPEARALLAALGVRPRPLDRLAEEAGLGAGPAWVALLDLELRGLARQEPEGVVLTPVGGGGGDAPRA